MIKLVQPMKRKPGLTTGEFREYYESHHRLIGEKYLAGYASKYMRRFMNPMPDRSGNLRDPEYDVLLEIWYPDQETFEACARALREPEAAKEIADDEAKLFDIRHEHMRSYLVDEYVSDMETTDS